ncbi:MAG: hypothetical protein IKB56_06250, partial [Clostridia bacterium]|nr:hypothetical protein [Clostridia bacterium]
MKYKITVELDDIWVLKHQHDDTLPIDVLKEFVSKKYENNVEVIEQSFNHIVFNLQANVETSVIQNTMLNYFSTYYQVTDKDKESIIKMTLEAETSLEKNDDADDDGVESSEESLDELLDRLAGIY